MSVLINFKICDNAKECNGVAVCKTGAISWDEQKKTLVIDNSKCINCGLCEKSCLVNAIKVAKTDEEYQKLAAEIENDPRTAADLFVDRYGASPIQPAFLIPDGRFDLEVLEASKPTIVEVFNNESIQCLLKSIPIKDLFEGLDVKYRRLLVRDNDFLKKYSVSKLPSLVFFNNGKLIGKIEGYYGADRKKELSDLIKSILS